MTTHGPDPLKDTLDLQVRIRTVRALLELQRWQIEVLNSKLYSAEPGGVAARRLLALKQSGVKPLDLPTPASEQDF